MPRGMSITVVKVLEVLVGSRAQNLYLLCPDTKRVWGPYMHTYMHRRGCTGAYKYSIRLQ